MGVLAALADGIGGLAAAVLVAAIASISLGLAGGAAMAGVTVVPSVIAAMLASSARTKAGAGAARFAIGGSVAIATSAWLLAVFGDVLKVHTHHHGLAGTTFALVGLGVVVACVAIGARLGAWAPRRAEPLARVALAATAVAVLLLALRGGLFAHAMVSFDAIGLGGILAALLGWAWSPRKRRNELAIAVVLGTAALVIAAMLAPARPATAAPDAEEAPAPVR